jgi:hypothetical protein
MLLYRFLSSADASETLRMCSDASQPNSSWTGENDITEPHVRNCAQPDFRIDSAMQGIEGIKTSTFNRFVRRVGSLCGLFVRSSIPKKGNTQAIIALS